MSNLGGRHVPGAFDLSSLAGKPTKETSGRPLQGASQNARGGQRVITLGGTPQQIGSIVQAPRDAGEDAEIISVTLGFSWLGVDPLTLVTDVSVFSKATLDWGVGGANFSAQCDWMNGVTLSIPASSMNVGLIAGGQPSPTTPIQVQYSASLSYGSPSGRRSSPARYTYFAADRLLPGHYLNDADNNVAYIAIPAFATSFILVDGQVQPTSYQAKLIRGNAGGGSFATRYDMTSLRNQQCGMIESQFAIPNGAMFMSIANTGTVISENLQVIFNLSL
jgi:hypothetical protein